VLHVLNLTHAADTVIGDAMLRGVSGGERRRVTSGEMLVSSASVLLMDEISTGE
jgi:ABC-type multidrug transport system ATPase subunit